MAFQQLPSPNVGRLCVIAVRDPLLLMVYVEMLDTSVPLGWFSETMSWPIGVNTVAKTPAVTLLLATTVPSVPSPWIGKTSMLFEAFSITTSHCPLGLTEMDDPPEFAPVRNTLEFVTSWSLPKPSVLNISMAPEPPALSTYTVPLCSVTAVGK